MIVVEDRKSELDSEEQAEAVSTETVTGVAAPHEEPQGELPAQQSELETSEGSPVPEANDDSVAVEESGVESSAGVDELGMSEPEAGLQQSDDSADEEPDDAGSAQPLELIDESAEEDSSEAKQWYILKVQVNREKSICDALIRRVKVEGLDDYFGEILIPTEDVREFTKTGKQRIVKRKLYPGYILVNMAINDDTWFLVRETPGIGDFTGAAGKPTPMESFEVDRILKTMRPDEEESTPEKTNIRFKQGDRVRVKEGYFQNFEGEVESIDEANGRITVMINIFGRPTPVELDHWQFEDV